MLRDNNYLIIQGWMVNKLNLKGCKLLLYALIYGFSQDEESNYHGSIQYLEDWTNCSRQSITAALKELIDSNLIIKEASFPSNKYSINKDIIKRLNCKESLHDCKETLHDCKENLQNNIYNNINNNIDNNISNKTQSNSDTLDNNYIKNKNTLTEIEKIVKYMNDVCGTKFKANSLTTKKLISSRLKEGYTFNDFKDVIDFKYKTWGINPVKFSDNQLSSSYLRPSTLFGNKFEGYLQAAWLDQSQNANKVSSSEKSSDRSNLKF